MASKSAETASSWPTAERGNSHMIRGKAIRAMGRLVCAGLLFAGLFVAYGHAADGFLTAMPEQVDTGTVPEGKTIEVTVSIQNTWNAPIEITSVRTS